MEGIEKYGDLSDKELLEFFADIMSGDEEIEEAEASADEKICDEEAQSMLSELPENAEIEAYYGDKAWVKPYSKTKSLDHGVILRSPEVKQKAAEGIKEANIKKSQRLKEDRIRIQREAFNQNYIQLSSQIDKPNVQLLISLLTKEHNDMVNRYSNFINRRLAALLGPFIPRRLRSCKVLYPKSVRICPGFMYKASEEYGGGLTFWATPSIPYYFEQGTEQELLLKNKPEFLYSVDKAVLFYHEHLKKRQEKELRYASTIIQNGVRSYFDLLKLNPFWFEILYNELKKIADKDK